MKLFISRRWAVFVITSLLFILSQFYRASIAVITPQLITDLSLDSRGLSLMSASFFYAFALSQIPIGIYLDYVGPRKTMTALSLIAVIGALVFAWASSLSMLILGRILLGIGMACNLMGTLKLLTLWFGPLRFATLSSLVISIGTAGNIAATTPLVLIVQSIGWRVTFSLFAIINMLLALMFFLIVRDRPHEIPGPVPVIKGPRSFFSTLSDLRCLYQNKNFWIISFGTFCRYGTFAAVQTLWAGPFLMRGLGLSALNAGNLILILNIGYVLGGPFWGVLSDRLFRTRKWIIIIGLISLALTLFLFASLSPETAMWILTFYFFGFGVFSSAGGLMYTQIKELMPIGMAGTAMTSINLFTMIGAAVFLQGIGSFMQQIYPHAALGLEAFKGSFLVCAACLAAVSALYTFTRDTGKND